MMTIINALILASLALLNTVTAQNSTTTSSAPAATHTVSVGADGFNFFPHETQANVGDVIEYRFYPQNHSVARAAFGPQPCIPYELSGPGLVGFWSGFEPVQLVTNSPPIFHLLINDTSPIFFYCSAPGACLQGMIGVINPNTTQTFAQQFAYTQNATDEFSPEQVFPAETSSARTITSASATATATPISTSSSTSSANPTNTSPASSSSSHSSLGTGPIVGIAIGGLAVIILAASVFYMCGRQKTFSDILKHSSHVPPNPGSSPHTSYQPTSDFRYPSIQGTMLGSDKGGQFRESFNTVPMMGGETESFRSLSPPLDGSPRSGGFGGMGYFAPQMQEVGYHGVSGQNAERPPEGPHELSSSRSVKQSTTSTGPRSFSYTDSETGRKR